MKGKEIKEAENIQQKNCVNTVVDSVLIFLLPFISVIIEHVEVQSPLNWWLFGKWLVFWTFGFRLFASGIKQASDPAGISEKNNNEMFETVRELGVANICLGVGGILSLINETWRQIIAIIGCLFFGLAVLLHFSSKVSSKYKKFTIIEVGTIFLLLLIYVICTLQYF